MKEKKGKQQLGHLPKYHKCITKHDSIFKIVSPIIIIIIVVVVVVVAANIIIIHLLYDSGLGFISSLPQVILG
jgi:hypothetical protein